MAKDPRDKIKTNGDMVTKRYGSTTGASKGSKPAPPATTKVKKLRPGAVAVEWRKKF